MRTFLVIGSCNILQIVLKLGCQITKLSVSDFQTAKASCTEAAKRDSTHDSTQMNQFLFVRSMWSINHLFIFMNK